MGSKSLLSNPRKFGVFTPEILDHVKRLAGGDKNEVILFRNRALQLCEEIEWCWARISQLEHDFLKEQGKCLAIARKQYEYTEDMRKLETEMARVKEENKKIVVDIQTIKAALHEKATALESLRKGLKELHNESNR